MGAFFLYRPDKNPNLDKVKDLFLKKGFNDYISRNFGPYKLVLYQKVLIDHKNYIEDDDAALYAIGTPIVKNHTYGTGMNRLFLGLKSGNKEILQELFGHYCILFRNQQEIKIIIDPAGIQNIFYNKSKSLISSSMLAVLTSDRKLRQINRLAATEILLTGNLVGPDTVMEDLNRVSVNQLPQFDDINIFTPSLNVNSFEPVSKEDAINNQLNYLNDYFTGIQEFCEKFGVSSGITGGLDSRLLLILIKKHLKDYQFYSTFRKKKGPEFLCAEEVCRAAKVQMIAKEWKAPLEADENTNLQTLDKNFYFLDGQVRTHHLWVEDIHTPSYRSELLGKKRIAFSGVGGEQYRNEERMIRSSWHLDSWLKNELLLRYSGYNALQESEAVFTYFRSKIVNELKLNDSKRIDHFQIKRYFNEIYNPANRTLRTNADNQLAFFISPFTDAHLSFRAYEALPFLGYSKEFEINMIRKMNREIAAVMTDYGFNLVAGESFSSTYLSLVKELVPKQLFLKLNQNRKKPSDFVFEYANQFGFAPQLISNVTDLGLPLNITELSKNAFLGPLLFSMGYLIEKLKSF